MLVRFHSNVDDKKLMFAVIAAKYKGKWVLCKHKDRDTYEFPGGHREPGEDILATAKRELYEETGAIDYIIEPVSIYSYCGIDGAIENKVETFGKLYYADIRVFGKLPNFEIARIELFEELPSNWTYSEIQPKLLEKIAIKKENMRRDVQKPNGEIVINNASAQAIYKAQRAFEGVAEDIGLNDEEDVQKLVDEVRCGKDKDRY